MRVTTVRDLGALVRAARQTQGMTQADLAARLGVGREWVVRLESGQPRVEAQKVLDTLVVLGLGLDVEQPSAPGKEIASRSGVRKGTSARKAPTKKTPEKKTSLPGRAPVRSRKPGSAADAAASPSSGASRAGVGKVAAKAAPTGRSTGIKNRGDVDPFESLFSKLT
ncbi:hypothetical protein GCM10022223_63280 [Kineosporia mesophila]|uniref:HTH cro/C1-type domain-containing protein n=1 Tax=Kineosporia mesophila TaxID=566012 RepID=A0ABP7AN55_9ACTN